VSRPQRTLETSLGHRHRHGDSASIRVCCGHVPSAWRYGNQVSTRGQMVTTLAVTKRKNAKNPLQGECSASVQCCGMQTQILTDLELHAVNFGEKARRRGMVVRCIGFHRAQMSHLRLEPGNALQGHVQFVVIGNHKDSRRISTIPL
jgi:hypothetical protein